MQEKIEYWLHYLAEKSDLYDAMTEDQKDFTDLLAPTRKTPREKTATLT